MSEELAGLNLVELFDMLAPVEAPHQISMWPETVGWVWLFVVLLILTILMVWRWLRWRRANMYRRAALAELKHAGDDPTAIANILRRTALAAFSREEVAQLHGERWIAFLDRVCERVNFSGSEAGKVLSTAAYMPVSSVPDLKEMAEIWIRDHERRGAAS